MRGHKTIEINNDSRLRSYAIKVANNQKVIQVHRKAGSITFASNYKAMKALSSNGYVLYMYLLMHSNSRVWALSSEDVYVKTNLTKNTYPKAVNELINAGYLTEEEINIGGKKFKKNAFHLWEDPENKIYS